MPHLSTTGATHCATFMFVVALNAKIFGFDIFCICLAFHFVQCLITFKCYDFLIFLYNTC